MLVELVLEGEEHIVYVLLAAATVFALPALRIIAVISALARSSILPTAVVSLAAGAFAGLGHEPARLFYG